MEARFVRALRRGTRTGSLYFTPSRSDGARRRVRHGLLGRGTTTPPRATAFLAVFLAVFLVSGAEVGRDVLRKAPLDLVAIHEVRQLSIFEERHRR